MIALRSYVLPADLAAGSCPVCGRPFATGHLVVTTLIDTRHLGCADSWSRENACCPWCSEQHPQPYSGECLT